MGSDAKERYEERQRRIEDAIELKTPDRVPVLANFRYFAARNANVGYDVAYYDSERWIEANRKVVLEYEPDLCFLPFFQSGRAYEMLGLNQIAWPGHGLPNNVSHQFIEREYMSADEYELMLSDPSDFAVRTYFPRICAALEPLRDLPKLNSFLFGYRSLALTSVLVRPEIQQVLQLLLEAGREESSFADRALAFEREMEALGFPALGKVQANPAFDVVADYLRGLRGVMLDMYRRPELLLKAIGKLEPLIRDRTISRAKRTGERRVFITLHCGSERFMSEAQFERFYWPSAKQLMLDLIDEGLTPCPFFEGNYNRRLKYLRELPEKKILARFDQTDLFEAKKILRERMCLCGNVSPSLMQLSTPDDVRSYCKELIDRVGEGGGFVMSTGTVLDEAKPENVRALMDFTKSYGVYR